MPASSLTSFAAACGVSAPCASSAATPVAAQPDPVRCDEGSEEHGTAAGAGRLGVVERVEEHVVQRRCVRRRAERLDRRDQHADYRAQEHGEDETAHRPERGLGVVREPPGGQQRRGPVEDPRAPSRRRNGEPGARDHDPDHDDQQPWIGRRADGLVVGREQPRHEQRQAGAQGGQPPRRRRRRGGPAADAERRDPHPAQRDQRRERRRGRHRDEHGEVHPGGRGSPWRRSTWCR